MSNKKKKPFIDDNQVIADMNIDGVPRSPFRRKPIDHFSKIKKTKKPIHLSRKEHRSLAFGVTSAYLLFGLAIFGGLALFILFCIKIWFKY